MKTYYRPLVDELEVVALTSLCEVSDPTKMEDKGDITGKAPGRKLYV